MKKLLCGLAAFLLLFSACKQEEAPPAKIVTTTGKKAESSASTAGNGETSQEAGEATGVLEQFAKDLQDTSFTLAADCPETEGQRYQRVRTDEEFGPKIAKILLDNEAQPAAAPKTEGRMLILRAENGDVEENAVFRGLDDTDPDNPGKMVLELEMADGQSGIYLFESSVFKQIDALYRERTEGVKTEFQGNATLVTSKYDLARLRDEQGYDTDEFLQFGTRILWRFTPHAEGYAKPSTLEMLDTVTGQSVYTSTIPETVNRMEKFDGEAGFDYRLITPTGIYYRSSSDRSREKVWRLPGIVSLFSASQELSGTFDLRDGKLAYASGDGVYLADENGGNAQPLLFHSALTEIMKPAAGAGYAYYFNDPHFLLGGKRLATSIVSPQMGERRLGFAVTNLDTLETAYFTGATAADGENVRYLNDKVLVAQDAGVITLINAENNDRGALPLNGLEGSIFLTHDCKTFAVWEPKVTGTEAYSSMMYLSGNQNVNDLSKRLLSTYGGEYKPVGITEEYVVGLNEDSRGVRFAVTRYQTAARSAAAVSSAGTESGSSSMGYSSSEEEPEDEDEDSEGGLPPDITPDI